MCSWGRPPSLRDAPRWRKPLAEKALASPFGRRPQWLPLKRVTLIQVPPFLRGAIAFLDLVRYTCRGTALLCPYTRRYNFVPHLNGNRYRRDLEIPKIKAKHFENNL